MRVGRDVDEVGQGASGSCRRQVSRTEQICSIQRLPRSDWVPKLGLAHGPACLSALSAALLVGSMPGTSQNVHSASCSSSTLAAKVPFSGGGCGRPYVVAARGSARAAAPAPYAARL